MGEEYKANAHAHEKGVGKEEVCRRYNEWAVGGKYDEDLNEDNYQGPNISAECFSRLFPDEGQRQEVKILDIAAGSGFAGQKLKAKGFTRIDALEPSAGLLEQAKAKAIYTRTFCNFLGEDSSSVESDYYDATIICGGMGEGHIPTASLTELPRVVKPGGYCVIVMRQQYLEIVDNYKDILEPFMAEMEAQGKWKQVERNVVSRYSWNNDGVVFVFKVMCQGHDQCQGH